MPKGIGYGRGRKPKARPVSAPKRPGGRSTGTSRSAAGRARKPTTTGRRRPTLPSQASQTARDAVTKKRRKK